METKEIAEYLDQERWLLNNGLVTDSAKNQLFFCGSIVHREVKAVELEVTPEKKLVSYQIFVDKGLLNRINKYNKLSTETGLLGMWRFKRLLKKEGNLNFTGILNKFVKDYCGPKWSVKVQVLDFDKFFNEEASGEDGSGWVLDQLPDAK